MEGTNDRGPLPPGGVLPDEPARGELGEYSSVPFRCRRTTHSKLDGCMIHPVYTCKPQIQWHARPLSPDCTRSDVDTFETGGNVNPAIKVHTA